MIQIEMSGKLNPSETALVLIEFQVTFMRIVLALTTPQSSTPPTVTHSLIPPPPHTFTHAVTQGTHYFPSQQATP